MITYQPSSHFLRALKDFDDTLFIRWDELVEQLQIFSRTSYRPPVFEHKFHRNNHERLGDGKRPIYNWEMEWMVLKQLERGRLWQHMSAREFQNNMLSKREKHVVSQEKTNDGMMHDFMSDPYWHKKRLKEFDNNDYGSCATQWAGHNPGGN